MLERLPNAFFTVCLTAAHSDDASRKTVEEYRAKLEEDTRWQPNTSVSFAGVLRFTRYGFCKRQLMKRIAKQGGLAQDTRRDHEYTDWQAVTAFTSAISKRLQGSP